MPDMEADYTIDWDDNSGVRAPAGRPAPAPADWPENEADDRDDAVGQRFPGDEDPRIPARTDRDLAVVQSAAVRRAGHDSGGDDAPKSGMVTGSLDKVTLLGKEFRIADRIGLMPLLKFSSSADVDTTDPRALSAMYTLLRDCIYEGSPACGECDQCEADQETACKSYDRGDWAAFEEHAMLSKADAEELLDVVAKVLELVSGRPTKPRAGSLPGPRQTRRASTGSSSRTGRGRGLRR
jgi:hypothetical protein